MRTLIVAAKVVSTIFRPIYYPLLCCVILFTLTPLSRLPLDFMLSQIGVMAMFTIVFPLLLTFAYRYMRHLSSHDMRLRNNRIVPYLIFIFCYVVYLHMMHEAHMPYLLLSVLIVALCIQVICTAISLFWKVSVHSAGAGAIIGALSAYGAMFHFNPLAWICLAFIVAGLVGTSRMILRQHSLSQILIGTGIGVFSGFFGILRGDLLFILGG
ncbi:MAG: hypothetical protein KBT12_04510 [Bacteroidales bacterium]|nr:hypothetical protein [Candidatus Physcousia equi]